MTISVKTHFARFESTLDALGRRQLPFAAALALNQTARIARDDVTRVLPAIFDAKGAPPTPFTMQSIGYTAARKSNLRAEVFVKRKQAEYLAIEETGGTRLRTPGHPVLTPVEIARNPYGNIPKGMIRRLAADPEAYFLGTIRGVYGLWERTATGTSRHLLRAPRGLRLLVAFRDRAEYRPRFGFHHHVRQSVNLNFPSALRTSMRRAIATAKPE